MNILLTSIGRRSYMVNYFKKALKGIGELHAANSIDTYSLSLAQKATLTPLIYDDTYIDFLLNYCIQNYINAIIPFFDIDLPILAKNKSKFDEIGVTLVVSSYETTQICNDKWLTYQFLKDNNFETPKTYISLNDCLLAHEKEEVSFPLIIKPRWGMGSIGLYQADELNELEVLYRKSKKIIFNSYIKYESNADPDRSVIIQEKLIGTEFGIDVFNDLNANFLTCVPKRKLSMHNGETVFTEVIENKALYELGENLALKLNHKANLDVDGFEVDGNHYIIDLNCRFGGLYPYSHLAGANFPKAIVQMLMNKRVSDKLLKTASGILCMKDIIPVILK